MLTRELLLLFIIAIRQTLQLGFDKDDSQSCGKEVRNWCGVHNAVDTHIHWQDQQKRQQEDDLSGQGQEHTAFWHTYSGKEVGRNRLQEVDKGEEHINTEVLFRKLEVFFTAAAEETNDLAREQLEAQESNDGNTKGYFAGQKQSFLYALIIAGTIVIGNDRLNTLTNTDNDGEEDHTYLGDDTGAGQRDTAAVYGLCAVEGHGVVHYDLHHHHGDLIEEWGQAKRDDRQTVFQVRTEVTEMQLQGFEAWNVQQNHQTRYGLSDHSCPCGTGHTHIKTEDEQRVQNSIDQSTYQVAAHGVFWAAVTTNQVCTTGGQNQEGEAK